MIEYIIMLFLILGIAGLSISTLTKGTQQRADNAKEKINQTINEASSSKDINKSSEDTIKSTTNKEETQKQEIQNTVQTPTVETKAENKTVTNPVSNPENNQNTTVIIKEVQVPVKQDNSFMSNLGSNLIAELVVALLFAGITWVIKDKVSKRKQKLNMKKR